MMRDLIERFGYRYRLWVAERMGDKVGAGMPPPLITTRNEPASRMVFRLLWVVVSGLALLGLLGRILSDIFPAARPGIATIVLVLAGLWCVAGIFLIAGEWLAKRGERDNNDKIPRSCDAVSTG